MAVVFEVDADSSDDAVEVAEALCNSMDDTGDPTVLEIEPDRKGMILETLGPVIPRPPAPPIDAPDTSAHYTREAGR